ncbi:tetratricopeptide repeat protein [Luteolibacter soli]|uniref:Tetratricopeptide repeat protein n=1 Tax=Luteolibacter soli TaxID=3135280 RepID=A0ABU9AN04_9BACT
MLLLAAVVLLAFQQVFKAPFAFDDSVSIAQIRKFTSWREIWGPDAFMFFRPVKNLFFYLVEQIGGEPWRYHWVNLAAYYLAACGVFGLTLRLSGNVLASFAAGAIWALSPTGGTVAVWASCFNINIAAASMAFCAIAYDVMRSGTSRHPALPGAVASFFLLLGLLSYETAIATAPLLVLVDLFRGRKVFSKPSSFIYVGIAAIVLTWLVCRQLNGVPGVRAQNPSLALDMPSWQLTASAPYFLWTHFLMWAAPSERLETFGSYLWDRSVPAVILPFCWILLISAVYLGVRFWKRAPLLIFGAAWFLIAAFPSGNFVPLKNTPYADYYVPIPSIGLCIMMAAILRATCERLREPGLTRPAMGAAVATILAIAGWRLAQLPVLTDWLSAWEIPPRVMARTAAARPHQYFAQAVMAYDIAFTDQDKTPEILDLVESSALAAEKDMPDLGIIHASLGEVARCRGQREQAIALFEKALVSRHTGIDTLLWSRHQLVVTLMEEPAQLDRAYANLLPLLRQRDHKDHPKYVLLAAKLMRQAGKPDEEIKALEKGLQYHPDNADILAELESARARATNKPS